MSPDRAADPLPEERFMAYVATALQLPSVPVPTTRLYEDLALDSLAVYELLVAVEELGVEVNEEQWVRASTVGDCYRAYRAALPPPART